MSIDQELLGMKKIHDLMLKSHVVEMSIDVSLIPDLASAIPDRNLVIDEVFPPEELRSIHKRFSPYLEDQLLLPFLGTLGGNTIALGFGEMNAGRVFYYDMDFGLFELSENVEGFITVLNRDKSRLSEYDDFGGIG